MQGNREHFSNRFCNLPQHSDQPNNKIQRNSVEWTYEDKIDAQAPEIIDDPGLDGGIERRLAEQCVGWMTSFGAGLNYKFSDITSSSDDENLELMSHRIKRYGERIIDRRISGELQIERRRRWFEIWLWLGWDLEIWNSLTFIYILRNGILVKCRNYPYNYNGVIF